MYLCLCKDVTERDVEQVARAGTTTPEGLIGFLERRVPEVAAQIRGAIRDRLARG